MTIFVEMSEEEVAARYLARGGYCAVEWEVIQHLVDFYDKNRKPEDLVPVYLTDAKPTSTWNLRDSDWRRVPPGGGTIIPDSGR